MQITISRNKGYPDENPIDKAHPDDNPIDKAHPDYNPIDKAHPDYNPIDKAYPDQNPIDKAYPDQNPEKQRICRSKSEVIKRITLQSEETDHIQTMIRGDCVQSSIF